MRTVDLLSRMFDRDRAPGTRAILQEFADAPAAYRAYALATAMHETAGTMQPVHEYGGKNYFRRMYDITGDRPSVARQLGNTQPGDGARYAGRGYVQLTGKRNYAWAQRVTGLPLLDHPELAQQPDVAARIMREGLESGAFTGKSLNKYLGDPSRPDFKNARRTVNGLDRADRIAGYADQILGGLGRSQMRGDAAMDQFDPVAELASIRKSSRRPTTHDSEFDPVAELASIRGASTKPPVENSESEEGSPFELSKNAVSEFKSSPSRFLHGVNAGARQVGVALGELAGMKNLDSTRQKMASESEKATGVAGEIGKGLPTALLTAPVSMSPGGILGRMVASGIASGALTPGDAGERAQAAGIGGLAQGAGELVGGLMPYATKAAKKLMEEGVTLSPAQILTGGDRSGANIVKRAVRALEDKATSIPYFGDVVKIAQSRGAQDLRDRAIKNAAPRGFAPEGETMLQKIDDIGDEFSKRYGNAVAELPDQITPNIKPSAARQAEIHDPKMAERQAKYIIDTFNQPMTGEELFRHQSDIGREAREMLRSPMSYERSFGAQLQDAADQAYGALDSEALNTLRPEFRAFAPLRDAVQRKGGTGDLTLRELAKIARASGKRSEAELYEAGASVLPSTYADSGTAGRLLQAGIPLATIPAHLVGGAALSLPVAALTSRVGQRALAGLLPGQQTTANALKRALVPGSLAWLASQREE